VLHKLEGLDVSEGGKQVLDLLLRHFQWDVLDVHIVDELSQVSSVLWLEQNGSHLSIVLGELQGLLGRGLVIEADETIASGGVVGVERNLKTLNFSESFEFLLKIGMLEVLGDALDEHTVGMKFFLVASEQLSVELEGSALLALDIEVSHGLDGLVELDGVLDHDDGGVEWSGDVLSDLWLNVKHDSSLLLESDGDFP